MNAIQHLSVRDLSVIAGEPRVRDVDLGARLGMAQPLNIRPLIRKNRAELERYGRFHAARESIQMGPRGRRDVEVFHLNEGQALLMVMFSRTERAADVRQELIEVFMAWRRGALTPPQGADAFDASRQRAETVAATLAALTQAAPEVAQLTYLPLWSSGRRPSFWADIEVRALLTRLHRQVTVEQARALCAERHGKHRTPSRSALYRYWLALDGARGLPPPRSRSAIRAKGDAR
jgi:hypothetical protein